MVGLIVILLITALLLWLIQKEHITVLGVKPTATRLLQFCTGLLLAGATCAAYHWMNATAAGNGWKLNPQITLSTIASASWWTLKSVLFEELLFRGALLYILIKKIGANKACLISAICFGIYHWFSFGAFGNPVQMILLFLMTGLFGWVLARAFAKTGSLYLPIALHLGWNLVHIVLFSSGPLGQQILIHENDNRTEGIVSLLIFLFQALALPLLAYFYMSRVSKLKKQADP